MDPAISVELLIRNAGVVRDPQGKPGLADFTGGLLRQGTERRSGQGSANAIEYVGGRRGPGGADSAYGRDG